MNSSIKRYLLWCFGITYLAWGGLAICSRLLDAPFSNYTWMYIVYVVGVLSPAIAAVIVWVKKEGKGARQVSRQLFRLPKHRSDWLLLLVVVATFQALPYLFFGSHMTTSFLNVFLYIPIFVIIGGLEEVGWRGFWLEHILVDNKWSKFKAALVIGLVWQLWHLPLFGILGTYQQQYMSLGIHTLWTLALSFVLTALYFRSRSILLCILTHASINAVGEIFILQMSWAEAITKLTLCILFFFVMAYVDQRQTVPKAQAS